MDLESTWLNYIQKHADRDATDWGSVIHTHDQPDGNDNPVATQHSLLPAGERKRQSDRLVGRGFGRLNKSKLVKNLIEMHHTFKDEVPEDGKPSYHSGASWYDTANAHVQRIADETGYHPRHVAGAMAAMSPRAEWDENLTTVHHLARHLHEFSDVEHPEDAANAVYKKAKEIDLRVPTAAPTAKGEQPKASFSTGSDNHAKAVRILRGEDPDAVLGGHKVRSFFNNIIDPQNRSGRGDVTMDRHAVSAAVKTSLGNSSMGKIFNGGSNKATNTKGQYGLFSDAYREAHRQLKEAGEDPGEHPHQFQAKIWNGWRNATKNQSDNTTNARFPYKASLDDPDYNPMGDTIDPFNYDSSEPDPDIFPEENSKWWKDKWKREGNEPRGIDHTAVYWPMAIHHHLAKGFDEWAFESVDQGSMIHEAAADSCTYCQTPMHSGEERTSDDAAHLYCYQAHGEPRTLTRVPSTTVKNNHPDLESLMDNSGAATPPPVSRVDQVERRAPYTSEHEFNQHTRPAQVAPIKPGSHRLNNLHEEPEGALPSTTGEAEDDGPFATGSHPFDSSEAYSHYMAMVKQAGDGDGMSGSYEMTSQPYAHGGNTPDPGTNQDVKETVGNPTPSSWWQDQHSTSADNPASTGPLSFGDTLDPGVYQLTHGTPNPDQKLLDPGPALTSQQGGPSWGFDNTAAQKPLPEWLSPRGSTKPSGSVSESDIAKAARLHLASLSIEEQRELIDEGEEDGRKAANYDRLDLTNTHYLALEEEFRAEEARRGIVW